MTTPPLSTKCIYIGLVGAPNAGKSTLMNALIGQKVSIVSPKVQTTRRRVLGILTEAQTQLVFMDTPGLFQPKKTLEKAMVKAASDALNEVDIVVWVLDAARASSTSDEEMAPLLRRFQNVKKPLILALNKIDLLKRDQLLAITARLAAQLTFERVFMISALKDNGLTDMTTYLMGQAIDSPWYFPEDQLTDLPLKTLAAEITREHLFRQLHQELPYGLTVEPEMWEVFDNGDIKISQVVVIEKETHKSMVLGKAGARLKAVGQAARHELMQLLGCTVHLKLHVKVIENWQQKKHHMSEAGLE